MYYDKKYALARHEKRKYKLSSFAGYGEDKYTRTLPCDHSDKVFNYRFDNGKLVSPYGISEFLLGGKSLPALPNILGKRSVYCAKCKVSGKEEYTFFISHEGGAEVYVDGTNDWTHIDTTDYFSRAVSYFKGSDEMLFLASKGGLYWFHGGRILRKVFDKNIKDVCAHFERLFVIVEGGLNSVWFSQSGNPLVWDVALDKGGYIEFDGTVGRANAVRSFNNYVYVFCDYGIYRITAFGDQTQFSLKKIYTSGGRIFSDTVAVCKDYVMFAAEDGLYLFDGYDVSAFPVKTERLISDGFDGATACFARNKYVISFCNLCDGGYGEINEAREGNSLLVADLSDKSLCVMRGISLRGMCALNKSDHNQVIGFCDDCESLAELDGDGLYLGQPMTKYWQSFEIDFDRPAEYKVITLVEYSSAGAFTLGIIADGEAKEYLLPPRENAKHIDVKGKKFVFYIRSDNTQEEILPPHLTVNFLK